MFKEVEFFSKKTSFNEGQRATSWAENHTSVAREVFSPRSGELTRVEGGFFAKELNLLTHPCKELIYYFIPRPKMGSGCKRGGGRGG